MNPLDTSGVKPTVPEDGHPLEGKCMPTGIAVAVGAVVVVMAALVTSAVSAGVARLGLVAACLGVFAVLTVNPVAAVVVGVLAFLVFDGFLVKQFGELSWHGAADDRRLFVLMVVSVTGLAGRADRTVRQWRLWRQRAHWVAARPRPSAGPAGAVVAVPDEKTAWPRAAGAATR